MCHVISTLKISSSDFSWLFFTNAAVKTFIESFINSISVKVIKVYIVFLFCSFLKMINIDKHQSRKHYLRRLLQAKNHKMEICNSLSNLIIKVFIKHCQTHKLRRDFRFITQS